MRLHAPDERCSAIPGLGRPAQRAADGDVDRLLCGTSADQPVRGGGRVLHRTPVHRPAGTPAHRRGGRPGAMVGHRARLRGRAGGAAARAATPSRRRRCSRCWRPMLYALAAIITRARCAERAAAGRWRWASTSACLRQELLALVAVRRSSHPSARADRELSVLFGPWAVMDVQAWLLMTVLALLMVALAPAWRWPIRLAPAAIVGAFDYTYVVFAVVWGYVLLDDVPGRSRVARRDAHRRRRRPGSRRSADLPAGAAGKPDRHTEGEVAMSAAIQAIERKLAAGQIILLDGGTGTELERRGAAMDDAAWCALATASHPELLRSIHEDYVRLGCDIITANTFASARHMMERSGKASARRSAAARGRTCPRGRAADRGRGGAGCCCGLDLDDAAGREGKRPARREREPRRDTLGRQSARGGRDAWPRRVPICCFSR